MDIISVYEIKINKYKTNFKLAVKYLYVRSRKIFSFVKNIMDFQSENQPENHDEGLSLFDKPVYSGNFQSMSDVIIQPISHSAYITFSLYINE